MSTSDRSGQAEDSASLQVFLHGATSALVEMTSGPNPVDPRIVEFLTNIYRTLMAHTAAIESLNRLHQQGTTLPHHLGSDELLSRDHHTGQ